MYKTVANIVSVYPVLNFSIFNKKCPYYGHLSQLMNQYLNVIIN